MFSKPFLPVWLWATFIMIICGIPGNDIPRLAFLDWLRPDKLVHLFVFGVLCYLLINGLVKSGVANLLSDYPRTSSLILCTVYGALIEVLQAYIFINRSGDVRDAIADSLGALLGIWLYNLVSKRKFQ